jgi:hypothetical protein
MVYVTMVQLIALKLIMVKQLMKKLIKVQINPN